MTVVNHWRTHLRQGRRLTQEEECQLAARARGGDTHARETLIQSLLGLVYAIASRYTQLAPLEDLIQEGAIGLIEGIDRFDPDRGHRLSTYAYPWINKRIREAAGYNQSNGMFGRRGLDLNQRIQLMLATVGRDRELTAEEIAATLDESYDSVLCMMQCASGISHLEDTTTPDGDGVTLEDTLESPGQDPYDVLFPDTDPDLERFRAAFDTLTEKERLILTLTHGLNGEPLTHHEIAGIVGCTPGNVKRIAIRATMRLQDLLGVLFTWYTPEEDDNALPFDFAPDREQIVGHAA